MDIKGEANVFKLDVAKDLKQLSENIEIIIGKKVDNSTQIKIEDKSKHLTLNLNFLVVGPIQPGQIEDIVKKVKEMWNTQSDVVKASGDENFIPFVSQGIGTAPVATGTANAVVIENTDYIFKGTPKPKFITAPGTLPMSVTIVHSEIKTDKT